MNYQPLKSEEFIQPITGETNCRSDSLSIKYKYTVVYNFMQSSIIQKTELHVYMYMYIYVMNNNSLQPSGKLK
jgi:hypothetical protein